MRRTVTHMPLPNVIIENPVEDNSKHRFGVWLGTNKCQYKCDYCACVQGNVNERDILSNLDKVLGVIGRLKGNCSFVLTGGEPGLLSVDTLNGIFQRIGKPLILSTNGLFLDKGYDQLFKEHIQRVDLHVVPQDYCKKYTHVEGIEYIYGVTVSHSGELADIPDECLGILDYLSIDAPLDYNKPYGIFFEDITTMLDRETRVRTTKVPMMYMASALQVSDFNRDNCATMNPTLIVDLENSQVLTCMNRRAGSAPLTEENVYRILTLPKPWVFPEYDKEICKHCKSQCLTQDTRGYIIDKKIYFRKRLEKMELVPRK